MSGRQTREALLGTRKPITDTDEAHRVATLVEGAVQFQYKQDTLLAVARHPDVVAGTLQLPHTSEPIWLARLQVAWRAGSSSRLLRSTWIHVVVKRLASTRTLCSSTS